MNIEIKGYEVSEARKAVGILATFNVNVVNGEGKTVLQARGGLIRKNTQDGTLFVAPPREKGSDSKWYDHWTIFPGLKGDEKAAFMDEIIQMVSTQVDLGLVAVQPVPARAEAVASPAPRPMAYATTAPFAPKQAR